MDRGERRLIPALVGSLAILIGAVTAQSGLPAAAPVAAPGSLRLVQDTGGHSGHSGAMAPQPSQSAMPAMAGMDHGSGGGHSMRPVDVGNAPEIAVNRRGGQILPATVKDGVKEFELTVGIVRWHLLSDVDVGAYAYNQQVPGPVIQLMPNERVRIRIRNDLPEPTTVHWHGLTVPNDQDGVPELSQPPIPPGGTYVYEFTVPDTPGTYFYHSHANADRQQPLGLYGALIIEDPAAPGAPPVDHILALGEWRVTDGQTFPAMPFDGMLPNYFTINGKSYPATATIRARVGEAVLLHLIGSGQFIHPIHIHGGPFEIVATDGNPVPVGARLTKDTVLVGPGERYDVLWTARRPGKWLLHCHINHHVTNDGAEVDGAGGMTMIIDVSA